MVGVAAVQAVSVVALGALSTLDGHWQVSLLRTQPPQTGFASSHFFLRRRQAQHPVRTRTMGSVRSRLVAGI